MSNIQAVCVLSFLCMCTALHAAEFIPMGIPPGFSGSPAQGVSADGLVVAGTLFAENDIGLSAGAFRWTEETGTVELGVPTGSSLGRSAFLGGGDGVSGDGSTIAGTVITHVPGVDPGTISAVFEAAIYTEADGWRILVPLPDASIQRSEANAVSFDGSVVVGEVGFATGSSEAFRWTEAEGMVGLGSLPRHERSQAHDVSADGLVVVGQSRSSLSPPFEDDPAPFVWSETTGMVELGVVGNASDISADGTVVAGEALVSSASDREAYRWTEETGVVGLGWLPGTELSDGSNHSSAKGINGDGSVIVGFSGPNSFSSPNTRAFIWSEESGMQDLQQLLVDQYGLGPSLEGWNLLGPQEMSANGQFIVGVGLNPDGNVEGWLVRLGAPIPEPSSGLLVAAGCLMLLSNRRGCTLRSI